MIYRPNKHKDLNNWKEKGYVEKPLGVYPFERFFGIDNFSIIDSNVKEYEILDTCIALTLFRSVDVLGRDNLTTRPNRASGINNVIVKTPDAQLIGQHFEIKYFVSLSNSSDGKEKIVPYNTYYKNNKNYEYYQNQTLNSFFNRLDRFEMPISNIKLEETFKMFEYNMTGSNSYISSFRLNFNKDVEIRFFNPDKKTCTIEFNKKYDIVNLISSKEDVGNKIKINFDYKTIKL